MKTLIVAATLAAAFVALQTAAQAQQRAPVYRYCLKIDPSRPLPQWAQRGGGVVCRFNTLAQCMASRGGPSDSCMVNPEYSVRR